MRVLVITGERYAGHEFRNVRLAGELKRLGHEVRHVGPGEGMLRQGFLWTVFSNNSTLLSQLEDRGISLFQSWCELEDMIVWCDVVLIGTPKEYTAAMRYARRHGRIIVQHRDTGGFDPWTYDPDILAVRCAWEIQRIVEFNRINDGTVISPDIMHVTGCVQYDDAVVSERKLDRHTFCDKYHLHSEKKIAVFFTPSLGYLNPNNQRRYRQVCDIVTSLDDFQLLIRPHPREYSGYKIGHFLDTDNTPSWVQLAPSVAVCAAEDKYDCLCHAEVVISFASAVAVDAALMRKPCIMVDLPEFLNIDYPEMQHVSDFIPEQRFTPPNRRVLNCFGVLEDKILRTKQLSEGVTKYVQYLNRFFPTGSPEYIGTEVSIGELKEVLSGGLYRFDDTNTYDDYIRKYCSTNDGLSWKRTADLVDSTRFRDDMAKRLRRISRLRNLQYFLRPLERMYDSYRKFKKYIPNSLAAAKLAGYWK
ncbi:hypothetical protein MTBLM1_40144 [Rhodospirillaceae bacterium LM-1]|nr:hypothetical protein MTBLM1_40144 [Rhodospirillaceae bacterium LM-1]